ncbi:MAG: RadC family protein [Clostridia bacterium]|nr:RadC family protein [Clostridia bacterium]
MSNQTTKKNIHAGHRERVRENVLKNGFEQLEDHRLLELLLFYSIPREDTNEIAHRLLNEFGSFTEIIKATPKKLTQVQGVGKNSAIQIAAIGELFKRVIEEGAVKRTPYKTIEELVALVKSQYLNEKNEKMLFICFDSAMRLKKIESFTEGDSVRTNTELKTALSKILENDPSFVIMAHNHPEGPALPSNTDVTSTSTVSTTLRRLGINLADHIIINRTAYFSMREDTRYKNLFDLEITE